MTPAAAAHRAGQEIVKALKAARRPVAVPDLAKQRGLDSKTLWSALDELSEAGAVLIADDMTPNTVRIGDAAPSRGQIAALGMRV